MARRDVDLVIRARDEAKGALESINRTLEKFVGRQKETQDEAAKTDSHLDRLGDALKKLQGDLNNLTGAGVVERELERARAAMTRLERSTERAAGEAIGYRREALEAARAITQLRTEAERVGSAVAGQEQALGRARAAQKALAQETRRNTSAQRTYANRQQKLGTDIAKQNLRLAEYRARFRELQIAITQVVRPTAALQREFDRAASNIRRTEARISDLTEKQRLLAAETDRANLSIGRARDHYGRQAASVGDVSKSLSGLREEQTRATRALRSAETAQSRLDASADKAAGALRGQEQALERAEENYRGVEQASRETEGALAELEGRVRGPLLRAFGEQRARLKASEQAFESNSRAAQELARELRTVENPSRELETAFERQREAAARARQEIREQQRILAELRGILRETGGDVDTFADRQNRFAGAVNRAERSFAGYRSSADAAALASERLARSQTRGAQQAGRLTRGTNNLSRATATAVRNQGLFAEAIRRSYGETRVALSFTQRLRSEVLSLIAAYGGFFAVIGLVRNTVDSFRTLESATNRLNVVFQGDETAINRELDFIRRNAERLGVEFGALAQEYTKFAIATQGTNLAGAETRRIFISVAEAARVNNLTLDQLRGTFVALTQIVSKGSLSMEELRQQLGDRLPGAIQIMAAGLKVGTDELIKMIEQGEVSSDSLSNFADELDRRFSDALPEALKSTNAALGRFQNAIFQTHLRVGEGGAIRGYTDLLRDLTATLDSARFRDFSGRVGAGLGTLFDVIGTLVLNFDRLIVVGTAFIGLKIAPFVVVLIKVMSRLPAIIRLNRIRLSSYRASLAATTVGLTGTAAAVGRLRAAMTLLMSSTGIGLLVALIGTGIGLWITRTEEATDALRQHETLLDRVRDTYDETGGSVERWREQIEGLTTTQARANLHTLQRELRNLQREFRQAIPRNVLGNSVNAGGGFFREVDTLFQEFERGEIEAAEFLRRLDDVNEAYRYLLPINAQFADSFDEIARRVLQASEKVDEARLILVARAGSEEEAAKALRSLNDELEDAADTTDAATERLEDYGEALKELRSLIPSVTVAAEELDERTRLEGALDAALQYADTWGQVLKAFRLFNQALNESDLTSFIEGFQGIGGGPAGLAGELIRGFEGFRETPYSDGNALRIGYGSDTITLSDGTVRAVTEGMRVTRADADRDLVRRIMTEFMPAAREAVGASGFDALDPRQQAVLTSLSYDYGAGDFAPGGDLAAVAEAVRSGSAEGVAEAIRNLGPAQFDPDSPPGEGLLDRRNREAALFEAGGAIDLAGVVAEQEELARLVEEEAEARRRGAAATAATIDQKGFEIAQQELINAARERDAAIEAAVRDARRENADIGDAELQVIREQAVRLFDLQQAEEGRLLPKERALEVEEGINRLLALRQQLESELASAQPGGAAPEAIKGIQDELQEVNRILQGGIQNALDFAVAMGSSDPEIRALISRLRELQFRGVEGGNRIRLSYEDVEKALSGSLFNGAMRFAEALARGKSVSESLRDAFLRFAADFLRQIAQMILQQLALNGAAQAILGAFGFGAGGAVVLHPGGQRGAARQVDAGVFMNAVRYRGGGTAGLMPGEARGVLRRGEEDLTQDDPRPMFNGGGQGPSAPGVRVKIVNALDGGQMISEALNTAAGEEAILNFIRSNAPSVRAAIET